MRRTLLITVLGALAAALCFLLRPLPPPPEPNRLPVASSAPAPSATAPIPTPEPSSSPISSEPALEHADVRTRQKYFDQLLTQPPAKLLYRWLAAAQGSDETTAALAQEAFITALANSQGGDPAEYVKALLDPTYSVDLRIALAHALAESAALPAVLALLQAVTRSSQDADLRSGILEAIATIGGHRRDNGQYPGDLSPPLETAYLQASAADPQLAAASARAIAQVGSETGIRLLLQKVGTPSSEVAGWDFVFGKIRNPAAIPALLEPLRTTQLNDPQLAVSGKALVHIGGEAAVGPLLEWLRQAPAEAQPLAADWFKNVREPVSEELTRTYLREQSFRSPEIKATIQQKLDATTPVDE